MFDTHALFICHILFDKPIPTWLVESVKTTMDYEDDVDIYALMNVLIYCEDDKEFAKETILKMIK